ncbi:hypothetical protein OAB00_01200 [Akkermansiaceae bacterium]|nr:hypothetical protein [Akkermansiaceae bacterium]
MKLLCVYEDEDSAEAAKAKISGPMRLATDRDDNQVVWRLFGTPSWSNFYALEMYELPKLKEIVDLRKKGENFNKAEHQRLIEAIRTLEYTYQLEIPPHWL